VKYLFYVTDYLPMTDYSLLRPSAGCDASILFEKVSDADREEVFGICQKLYAKMLCEAVTAIDTIQLSQ